MILACENRSVTCAYAHSFERARRQRGQLPRALSGLHRLVGTRAVLHNEVARFTDHTYAACPADTGLVLWARATADGSEPGSESFGSSHPPPPPDRPDRLTPEFDARERRVNVMHLVPTGADRCILESLQAFIPSSTPVVGVWVRWSEVEPIVRAQDHLLREIGYAARPCDRDGVQFETRVSADRSTLPARRSDARIDSPHRPGILPMVVEVTLNAGIPFGCYGLSLHYPGAFRERRVAGGEHLRYREESVLACWAGAHSIRSGYLISAVCCLDVPPCSLAAA